MRTDAGLVGAGYCFAFGARRARALAELVEDLAEVYVGRAPAPQARHAEAWRALNFIGHAGPSLLALAALDTACWDLAARAVNLPLFRFLGGDRTRVPTYASSGLWIDDSVDALVRAAALCHAWQQPVSSHLFTETSAHLLAATPNALILEHMSWWEPLFTEPVTIDAGCVVLSERPGIGCELSQASLQRYRV